MISFIVDTSAFISLESVYLLETVLKNFEIITALRAFDELRQKLRS